VGSGIEGDVVWGPLVFCEIEVRSGARQVGAVVVQCCFCGDEMYEEEPGLVTLVAVEVPRSVGKQAHSQQLWCHARCLARLHQSAVFDADRFEAAAATVDEEDRPEKTARARAADDDWPNRDDEQHGPR
jgi:hypothetical protein